LGKSIAMAYVEAALAEPGRTLNVDLAGKANPATVVPLPFYKRK
jgi:aminomethyltransferase